MPLSGHVDHPRRRTEQRGVSPRGAGAGAAGGSSVPGRRRGVAIDPTDGNASILSPILSHLPSIPSLKGLLPTSPKAPNPHDELPRVVDVDPTARATWHDADLDDGHGKRPLLLITSKRHALQIWAYDSSVIPDDPHVQEVYPQPTEVFSLPMVRCEESTESIALPGVETVANGAKDEVVSGVLIERGELWDQHGPIVAFITATPPKRASANPTLSLVLVSLRTGVAIKRMTLGVAITAAVLSSARSIVISISHPTPTIHILDPVTLLPSHDPIIDLPHDSRTDLPVATISGRTLAFVTTQSSLMPGADGLGSLVTARTAVVRRVASEGSAARSRPATGEPSSAALLTSAVELGGGVARGVWAGLKASAKVASKARASRLAVSAPAEGSAGLADDEADEGLAESVSLGGSSLLDEQPMSPGTPSGGMWIKVIDLFPRPSQKDRDETTTASTSIGSNRSGKLAAPVIPDLNAHFRLPATQSYIPASHDSASANRPHPPSSSVAHLSFSPDGTHLFAAPKDGKAFHIFRLHPAGLLRDRLRGPCKGEAVHVYELRRGNTSASVCEVSWDSRGRWIGVGTGKGTIHVFAIHPSGCPPSAESHAVPRMFNPNRLYTLSTIVHPVARLRVSSTSDRLEGAAPGTATRSLDAPGPFAFAAWRPHPLLKGTLCQDIAIYRPSSSVVDLARLSIRPVEERAAETQPREGLAQRRGSALTEMMRSRAGVGGEQSDLSVECAIKARWTIALAEEDEAPGLLEQTKGGDKSEPGSDRGPASVIRAEILTHSTQPCVLPSSIYLSKQVDFFAAKAIDEFTPLSIMDLEARTQRLIFRHEVEARASSPEVKSFDEPLSSALHTVIDSPPRSQLQIPGLPNGYPNKVSWTSSIPIRQVAAGLGEGMDRVRREYVRAQNSRLRRRASEALSNQLSFEADAVFPSAMEGSEAGTSSNADADADADECSASSPSSGMLPTTNTESSFVGSAGRDDADSGWEERWEDEYRRAVEDDGGPDDLVLGLLDEEQEERRKWEEARHKGVMPGKKRG